MYNYLLFGGPWSGVELFVFEAVNYGKVWLLYPFTVDVSEFETHFLIRFLPVQTINQEFQNFLSIGGGTSPRPPPPFSCLGDLGPNPSTPRTKSWIRLVQQTE